MPGFPGIADILWWSGVQTRSKWCARPRLCVGFTCTCRCSVFCVMCCRCKGGATPSLPFVPQSFTPGASRPPPHFCRPCRQHIWRRSTPSTIPSAGVGGGVVHWTRCAHILCHGWRGRANAAALCTAHAHTPPRRTPVQIFIVKNKASLNQLTRRRNKRREGRTKKRKRWQPSCHLHPTVQ